MTEPIAAWLGGWMAALPDFLSALALLSIAGASLYIAWRRRPLGALLSGTLTALVALLVLLAAAEALEAWSIWQGGEPGSPFDVLVAAASIVAAATFWSVAPRLASMPSREELNASEDALARALRELEAFTASVSHDLRSPLTSIAGQAGMLELTLNENATDDQRRRLQRLQGAVKQMSELIDALVTLSRTGRQPLEPETVDVSTLAAQIVAELRRRDPHRDVAVIVQPHMTVRADRRLLSEALAQLIGNAWKFTSRNASARIEIGQSTGPKPALHVRDNGVGFDMAYAEKLFHPFKRLHGPTEFEGSGVGLAMVSRIVERHRGRVWAEAQPNAGAVFYVELPPG